MELEEHVSVSFAIVHSWSASAVVAGDDAKDAFPHGVCTQLVQVSFVVDATCTAERDAAQIGDDTAEAGPSDVGPEDFKLLCVVGKGSYGKVFQ
eukprot:9500046-Pyramimonas_sp.AAC.2